MKYIVDTESALKVLYYFMAVDERVSDDEIQKFHEVAAELCSENCANTVSQVVKECGEKLKSMADDEEQYDLISEEIDGVLHGVVDGLSEGVVRRLLLWDLYAMAFSDADLHTNEKRIIAHIARLLEIEKSVMLEMEQLFATAVAIVKEEEELKQSNKPYVEIHPLVEEIEKRKSVVLKAARLLIEDDFIEPSNQKQKANPFAAGQRFGKAIVPKAAQAGGIARKSIKEASGAVGSAAVKGVKGIVSGTGKMLDKLKKTEIKLPAMYKKVADIFPPEMGMPKDAIGYEMAEEGSSALLICFNVDKESAMPFDDAKPIIAIQREAMQEYEGLIETETGVTTNGNKYAYIILKHRMTREDGTFVGVEYTCNINVELGSEIKFINASFVENGVTGIRDSVVLEQLRRNETVGADMAGWQRDPYDTEYRYGFLMNLSEQACYDEMFPNHPLTEARRLIEFIKGTS